MNTEKAIGLIKRWWEIDKKRCKYYTDFSEEEKAVLAIVELLQRGEKYEAIVNELEKLDVYGVQWRLEEIKQKYFPKQKNKTIELIKEIKKEVRELLDILEKGGRQ